jgi:hypothetical protein
MNQDDQDYVVWMLELIMAASRRNALAYPTGEWREIAAAAHSCIHRLGRIGADVDSKDLAAFVDRYT